eukprot:PhM_4_TR8340/c0_g1_i1/m.17916
MTSSGVGNVVVDTNSDNTVPMRSLSCPSARSCASMSLRHESTSPSLTRCQRASLLLHWKRLSVPSSSRTIFLSPWFSPGVARLSIPGTDVVSSTPTSDALILSATSRSLAAMRRLRRAGMSVISKGFTYLNRYSPRATVLPDLSAAVSPTCRTASSTRTSPKRIPPSPSPCRIVTFVCFRSSTTWRCTTSKRRLREIIFGPSTESPLRLLSALLLPSWSVWGASSDPISVMPSTIKYTTGSGVVGTGCSCIRKGSSRWSRNMSSSTDMSIFCMSLYFCTPARSRAISARSSKMMRRFESTLITATFVIFLARSAYLSVFRDSSTFTTLGLTMASMCVRLLPPSASLSSHVSVESRYGT